MKIMENFVLKIKDREEAIQLLAMDPKVCGELLTHHQRGNGVYEEALRVRIPLRQGTRTVPRWDLAETEACGGGKVFSWLSLLVWGFQGIYRRKRQGKGGTGPTSLLGAPPWGAPRGLVASSVALCLGSQVFWIPSVMENIILKVLFHLDSV